MLNFLILEYMEEDINFNGMIYLIINYNNYFYYNNV